MVKISCYLSNERRGTVGIYTSDGMPSINDAVAWMLLLLERGYRDTEDIDDRPISATCLLTDPDVQFFQRAECVIHNGRAIPRAERTR